MQYTITLAEKINHAYQILSRGMMVVNRLIPNEKEFYLFREAIENDKLSEYCSNSVFLSDKQKKLVVKYYDVCSVIEKMQIELTDELVDYKFASFPFYEKAVEIGITEEKRIIETYFKDHPNYEKIIKLARNQIEIIQENVDLILSLDPTFSIERTFNETNEIGLHSVKGLPTDDLALLVLRKINLDFEGNCLSFSDENIIPFLEHEFFNWAKYEVQNSNLTFEEKKATLNDNQLFLTFFIKYRPEINTAVVLALLYSRLPDEYRYNTDTLNLLWSMVKIYEKEIENSIEFCLEDTLSIKNIYVFINDLYARLEEEDELENPSISLEIKFFSLKRVAALYEELYEYEESLRLYRILLEDNRFVNSEWHDYSHLFILMVQCHHKINPNNAIDFIIEIILGKTPFLFPIDEKINNLLETKLGEILSENRETITYFKEVIGKKPEVNFTSDFLSSIISLSEEGVENDNINLLTLEQTALAAEEHFNNLKHYEEFETLTVNAQFLLLKSTQHGEIAEILEQKTRQIESLLCKTKHSTNEARELQMWKAKLKFLRADPDSLTQFRRNIQAAENSEFPKEDLVYWYGQLIRAHELDIKTHFNDACSEIEESAIKAANILMNVSVSDFGQEMRALGTQVEFEILLNCILSVLESIQEGGIETIYINWSPDIELTPNLKNKDRIIKLIWSLLVHRNKYLNAFYSYRQADNFFIKKFKELQIENQINLYHYFILNEKTEYRDRIIRLSKEFQRMQIPYLLESNYLNAIAEPENRSLFYFVFTKIDKRRKMIAISFHPVGHSHTGTKFHLVGFEDISDLESVFDQDTDAKSVFNNDATIQKFYDYLLKPFDLESRDYAMNSLYETLKSISIGNENEELVKQNVEAIDIYNDSFFNRISFEYLNTKKKFPFGVQKSITYIAHKHQDQNFVDFNRQLLFITEIPANHDNPEDFNYLENAKLEINGILSNSNEHNVRLLTGTDACLPNFLKCLEKRPAVLHFTTHGIGDIRLPSETSAILLAPDSENQCFLSYMDIIKLDLSFVDLVVLSACDSSLGKIERSVSMKGLAYAFLFAGVRNVLAAKTKISDKFSAVFISKFYAYLFDNNSVQESLRMAREYFQKTEYRDFNKMEWGKRFLSSWNLWS